MIFPAQRVLDIYREITNDGIPIWIDGGWGVDALIGTQTREHQDLDIIIPLAACERVKRMLEEVGFALEALETDLPTRLVMVHRASELMVDCHLVEMQGDGTAVQKFKTYEYVYSKEGFESQGVILDKNVCCLSVAEQISCRKNKQYSFDDTDRQRPGGINADRHDLQWLEQILLTENRGSVDVGTPTEIRE